MSKEIGRISDGFNADIVISDALSPSVVAAAQHDPVAAAILHSTPADIDTITVDGIVRKRDRKLVSIDGVKERKKSRMKLI